MKNRRDSMCFACGEDNPIGLHLSFSVLSEDEIQTNFVVKEEHQSYDGMMHGGLMAVLLDEVMGKLLSLKGLYAPTAKLEIRYRKEVCVGEKLTIYGRIVSMRGRMIEMEAKTEQADGNIAAEAKGKFMKTDRN